MRQMERQWPKGLKKTKPRECVLEVLERAPGPMSAADIYAAVQESGESAWLSTVYRTLELFEQKGLAVKISVLNNENALYELNRFEHKHYAVCLMCHKIIPMANCPMEKFMPHIEDKDFKVVGHNLEIYGYCRDCLAKQQKTVRRGNPG